MFKRVVRLLRRRKRRWYSHLGVEYEDGTVIGVIGEGETIDEAERDAEKKAKKAQESV